MYWCSATATGAVVMSEFERLREQAARLLALALKARERGDSEQADQLTAQAAQYLDKAAALNSPPTANRWTALRALLDQRCDGADFRHGARCYGRNN